MMRHKVPYKVSVEHLEIKRKKDFQLHSMTKKEAFNV